MNKIKRFCYYILANIPKIIGLIILCYIFIYPIETGKRLNTGILLSLCVLACLCCFIYTKAVDLLLDWESRNKKD